MSSNPESHKDNERKDQNGKGPEGTIPESPEGVGAGSTDEASNFEPEEDEGSGKQ